MQIIYVDTIFVTNTIINYLVLLATAKICAVPGSRSRMAAGAALGGVYAAISALPPAAFLRNPIVAIAFGFLSIITAFGSSPKLLRITLVFFAVSAAFAGAVLAVTGGTFMLPFRGTVLVVTFAVSYAVMSLVFRRTASSSATVVPVTIKQGGRSIELRALVDTGNSLVDPMTGIPVIVIGVSEVMQLFTGEIRAAVRLLSERDAVAVMEELGKNPLRFRLIPYNAVGVPGGLLLAFRPDEVVVDGTPKRGTLIALSPNNVSDNGTYSALIGA